MVEKNLIKSFFAILLISITYNVGLWLLTQSLYIANILGLLLLIVVIPILAYRIIKYIINYLNRKK